MAAEWRDATSYSRDDKERKPTAFALKFGGIRLSVTSGHIYYRGKWVMHCEPFYNTYPLAGTTEAEAKSQAVALVQIKIEEAAKELADYLVVAQEG